MTPMPGMNRPNSYREVRRQGRRYPDKQSVIEGIKRRKENGLPVNCSWVLTKSHRDLTLLVTAREYFGSWDNALRAAGIVPDATRNRIRRQLRRYPDKKSVISGIRKRRKLKLPLNVSVLCRGPATDVALWQWGREYFGSWGNALIAAGLDPKKIHKRRNSKAGKQVTLKGFGAQGSSVLTALDLELYS